MVLYALARRRVLQGTEVDDGARYLPKLDV